ncbi:MAG: Dabb family protein [Pyrinomonadaceae bacterium]
MSIIHLVCWKYKHETESAVRDEHRNRLRALKKIIPDIIEFEVGADVLHLDRSFDTGLFSRFADRNALDAYTVHPEHQKVAAMGKEIAEKVVSVDFESEK